MEENKAKIATSTPHVGPYLLLGHRLSLAPFALPVLAAGFVSIRLYLTWLSANRLIGDAKEFILASCLAAQKAASVAVSAVRWLATQLNEGMVEIATETVEAARKGALLCLSSLDGLISFFVGRFKSLYVGMFKVLVVGGLNVITTVTGTITSGLNSVADAAVAAVNGAQSALNAVIGGFSDLLTRALPNIPPLGFITTPPLRNINIPDPIGSRLTAIQNSLPTVDDLERSLSVLVSQPFAKTQTEVNNTLLSVKNDILKADLIPLPDPRSVDFCDDVDLSWVDKFGTDMLKPLKWVAIGFAILFGLFLLCSILWEIYTWGRLQAAVKTIQSEWETEPPSSKETQAPDAMSSDILDVPSVELTPQNVMILRYQLNHGYTAYFMARFRRAIRLPRNGASNISWFFSYITYPPALLCLLIGILGLIAVAIQEALFRRVLSALDDVDDEIATALGSVGNWTQKITTEIEEAVSSDSKKYAATMNVWMEGVSVDINDKVLRSAFVAAGDVNQTVIQLYGNIENGVRSTFKGTMFESVANDLIQRVLGNQLYKIDDAIVWMKGNIHIRLPHRAASCCVWRGRSN